MALTQDDLTLLQALFKGVLQDNVPGMIETGIQNTVPGMIETGIQNTVPGMIETGIQNTVPGMIETGIQNTVPKLIKETVQPMLDEAVSSLAQDTAEGFAEVHDKLDALSLDVHQLKDSQYDIRNRIDDHELRLQALGSMP